MANSCVFYLLILLDFKKVTIKAELNAIDLTNNEFQLDCLLTHNKFREKHCSSELKFSLKVRKSTNAIVIKV